jgi:phosphate transport system substrate-binding protein
MFFKAIRVLGVILLAVLATAETRATDAEVIGAGASFPAPAIRAWAKQYAQESNVEVRYRSVGSGEGIRRVTARSVDFAMTDVPLTKAELVQDDLLQFPVVVGAVVPIVNIPGVRAGDLKLTGELLADIYLGKIPTWDAQALHALNPELRLPNLPIRVIHRADSSGTSFIFTHYLSKVNPEWADRLGIGSRLRWPAGSGAKGNEGVSETVRDVAGSIGYVEYSYALEYQISTAQLDNKAGKFVRPSEAGIRTALTSANWSGDSFYEVLTNRDGEQCWPMVGISFALIHKKQPDRGDAEQTLAFLDWIYRRGTPLANALHYVSLEDNALVDRIESSWKGITDIQGGSIWNRR